MRIRLLLIPVIFIILINSGIQAQHHSVTLESLLIEMVDREAVVSFPDPSYKMLQYSSYDRASTQPGEQEWFANWDRTMFLREEENSGRREFVMFESDDPGAVVRFWMTFGGPGAGEGVLRFYFDGNEKPAIEGNALDVLSSGLLTGKPLSASVSERVEYLRRGHNLYLPIPFAESLKITYQSQHIEENGAKHGNEDVYYNINYRSYGENVSVETYSAVQLAEAAPVLERVQEKLSERDPSEYLKLLDLTEVSMNRVLKPGEEIAKTIDGSAAIREFRLGIEAENIGQALRSTVLEIHFDGEKTVWVPVGDFFGTGYQHRQSKTWYTEVSKEGSMSAWWVMPFQKSAEIKIHNLGIQPVKIVNSRVRYSKWTWDENSMHFGASWKQYSKLYTGEQKEMDGSGGPFDVNFTRLKGKGVYVGDAITLFNTAYDWWGEGDEKIYIDGEDFPSHFGTGTEDYYGYAWVRPEIFTNHPFISQPDGSGNITPGFTLNTRFRSLDAVPFRSELIVDMELWHWTSTVIDYAPTSFFYLQPGSRIEVEPDIENARREVSLRREDLISPVVKGGKINGQNLIVNSFTGGNMRFQYISDAGFTENKHLWWHNAAVGDKLELSLHSGMEGVYTVSGSLTKAPDFGVVSIYLNGDVAAESLNLFSESLELEKYEYGEFEIREGINWITVEIEGISPDGENAFFGLNYLEFSE